ncbi:unnamed protein product [Paramecium octaurelia]|uniref:Alpha-type protein kinase domain-containing protein n=1 Tax=Paramecium octaurelia TaxID=43137 RepID=A0A8S1U136_PAROT|nr:unnamed protein product [Paramecium octaurelia]
MNQQIPEILDTQSIQNNQQFVPSNSSVQNNQQAPSNFVGQNIQQFPQMSQPPVQFPNNQFAQIPQFPSQLNQFQFQPNFSIPPGAQPMMPRINTPGIGPGMGPPNVNPAMFQFRQNNGQIPPPIFQQNQVNSNDDEVQKLKEDVKKKNDEIQSLKNQLTTLNEANQNLQQEFQESKKELKGTLQKSKISFNDEIDKSKQQLYNYQLKCEELEEKERKHIQANKKLQAEVNILTDEIQCYIEKLNSLGQESQIKDFRMDNTMKDLKDENDQLKSKVVAQDREIQQKAQLIETLQTINQEYIEKESYIHNISSKTDEANLLQLNKELENNIRIIEYNYKELETNYKMLQIDNKVLQDKATYYEECIEELRGKLEQNQNNNQNVENNEIQSFIKEFQQRQQDVKNKQQDDMKRAKEILLQKKQQDQQEQELRNIEGKKRMQEQIQKAGKIQCCFVTDLFKSNEKTAKAIINAAKSCQKLIKTNTNRHSFWGAVCYGYSKNGFQMKTQEFSKSSEDISNFLSSQKLNQDNKDQPEDLKSALQAMLKLDWTEQYKLAVLIPNSPCHGKKYHNPKKYSSWFGLISVNYDTKPNDDMENIIQDLIRRQIELLVIRFNDETTVMCNQLEKIYQGYNAGTLFNTLSVKGLGSNNSDQQLTQMIQKMVGHIIGTNNLKTKTKINYQIRNHNFEEGLIDRRNLKEEVIIINKDLQQEIQKQGEKQKGNLPEVSVQDAIDDKNKFEDELQKNQDCQDGALQALCKQKDIGNFQAKVQCVDFNCKVYSVELKQASFESKKENIEKIRYEENDFDLKEQAQWQCIRTKNPFALGMMKKVYLMKKKNNTNEIYVVKIPIQKGTYNTLSDAVNDCRSHLIAKNLMKIFIEKLTNVKEKTPQVQYTQFLILEENQNKYWIAERYFEGDFKKYNNNDGYISDENSELNAISQGFSFFTYQVSQFSYIINDIQGINNYLTDPAINTVKGNFDETDVGEDGISNYLTIFQAKKALCEQLLKSIGIEID